MKTGMKITLGVVGGLVLGGLALGGAKALSARNKPAPEVRGGNVAATIVPNPTPAPQPASPTPSSPLPDWANNVNGALGIANNIFNTGLGFARQLGLVS